MQDILDLIKKYKEPGISVDVSMNLLTRFSIVERENFIRKMLEDDLPGDLSSEQREEIVQKFLGTMESGDMVGLKG